MIAIGFWAGSGNWQGDVTRVACSQFADFFSSSQIVNAFFCAKKFNIFYIFGREKFSTSSFRAPQKHLENPQKHLENPQKHIEFPTSDVFLPLYGPKKRGKNPVFRAISSSLVQR